MLVAAGGNKKLLEKLILAWSALGGVLFRGLLRLKGISVSGLDAETVIANVEKEYGVSLGCFTVLNHLRQGKKLHPFSAAAFAETLLEALSALVQKVDAMDDKPK
jgi:hypothetical protein